MGHPIDLPDAPFVLTLNTGREDAELDGMTADGQAIVVGGRRTVTLEQTAPAETQSVDAPVAAPTGDQVADVQPPQGGADALALAQRTLDEGDEPPAAVVNLDPDCPQGPSPEGVCEPPAPARTLARQAAVATLPAPAITTVPEALEEGAEASTATALSPVAGLLATTAAPPSAANQPVPQVGGNQEEELFGTQAQQWMPAPASVLTGAPVPAGVSGVMPFQQQDAASESWDPKALFGSP
jgi:hypothetical protein